MAGVVMPDRIPNPGSKEAQALGCLCPVLDNHYGVGILLKDGLTFWINLNCPVHAIGEMARRWEDQSVKDDNDE